MKFKLRRAWPDKAREVIREEMASFGTVINTPRDASTEAYLMTNGERIREHLIAFSRGAVHGTGGEV